MKLFYLSFLLLTSCSFLSEKNRDDISQYYFLSPSSLSERFPAALKDSAKSCMDSVLDLSRANRNYVWENGVLSEAQIQNLKKYEKGSSELLEKGDRILVWSPEMIDFNKPIHHVVPQHLFLNKSFEKELLKESLIDSQPREVLQFRIHLQNGEIVLMKKFYGNHKTVDAREAVGQLIEGIKGSFEGVKEVELSHTHPMYALTVSDKNGRKKYDLPVHISSEDYAVVHYLMGALPSGVVFSIKAIVPNGFFYKSSFKAK